MNVQRDRQGTGWVVQWREQGRRPSRKFALKRDAEAIEREIKRRRQLGPLAIQQLTARCGRRSIGGSSSAGHPSPVHARAEHSRAQRELYECHIAGALGDVPLGELTVARRGHATAMR